MMNKEQLKMLNDISDTELYDITHLDRKKKEIIFFLRNQKYIQPKADTTGRERYLVAITELGKSKLHENTQSNFRFWFPILLSNIIAFSALIISIIALAK